MAKPKLDPQTAEILRLSMKRFGRGEITVAGDTESSLYDCNSVRRNPKHSTAGSFRCHGGKVPDFKDLAAFLQNINFTTARKE